MFELNLMLKKMKNLKKIVDVVNNFLEIKTAIQLCIDFDAACNNFWMYHYKKNWMDPFGRCTWKYLKSYIDMYDICFKDNYKVE